MLRTAYIIENDPAVRALIEEILTGKIEIRALASGSSFLQALPELAPGCLLFDMQSESLTGPHLLQQLAASGIAWPVIAITGRANNPSPVEAILSGASDVLEKPFSANELLRVVERCFCKLEQEISPRQRSMDLLLRLTPRELDAFEGLVRGELNRETAERLGIGSRTAEMHRARMMKRLMAKRASDVVQIAQTAGYSPGARAKMIG